MNEEKILKNAGMGMGYASMIAFMALPAIISLDVVIKLCETQRKGKNGNGIGRSL